MNVLQNLFLFSPVDSLLNGKEVVKVRIKFLNSNAFACLLKG